MREIFCYLYTPETHGEVISLGAELGLQNYRLVGDQIAELANDGNARAAEICAENPNFFSFVCDI